MTKQICEIGASNWFYYKEIIRYFYLLLLLMMMMMLMTQEPLGPLVHFCLITRCPSQNTAEFAVTLTKTLNNTVLKFM